MPKTPQEIFKVLTDHEVIEWLKDATQEEIVAYISLRPSSGREGAARLALDAKRFAAVKPAPWWNHPATWISILAVIISLLALVRDYLGWTARSPGSTTGVLPAATNSPQSSK